VKLKLLLHGQEGVRYHIRRVPGQRRRRQRHRCGRRRGSTRRGILPVVIRGHIVNHSGCCRRHSRLVLERAKLLVQRAGQLQLAMWRADRRRGIVGGFRLNTGRRRMVVYLLEYWVVAANRRRRHKAATTGGCRIEAGDAGGCDGGQVRMLEVLCCSSRAAGAGGHYAVVGVRPGTGVGIHGWLGLFYCCWLVTEINMTLLVGFE